MEIKDLRQKSVAQLKDQLIELRQEQFNLRMQRSQGQLTQSHQFRNVRRDVARIKMTLGEKESRVSDTSGKGK
jgi:large subunit ribosomal protein L29